MAEMRNSGIFVKKSRDEIACKIILKSIQISLKEMGCDGVDWDCFGYDTNNAGLLWIE